MNSWRISCTRLREHPAAAALILLLRDPVIAYYQVTGEAKRIAYELMNAISFLVIFEAMNSILTKGVLRAGGDTKFLMAGDILFLWVASIPLGYLAGLVLDWPPFWVYTMLIRKLKVLSVSDMMRNRAVFRSPKVSSSSSS